MPRPKRKAVEKDPIKQEVEANPHEWPSIGRDARFMELQVFTFLGAECIEIKKRVSPRIPDETKDAVFAEMEKELKLKAEQRIAELQLQPA